VPLGKSIEFVSLPMSSDTPAVTALVPIATAPPVTSRSLPLSVLIAVSQEMAVPVAAQ
jgi:hypothetical protein